MTAKIPPELKSIADSLTRLEKLLTHHFAAPTPAALDGHHCWRWRLTPFGGRLTTLHQPAALQPLSHLVGLHEQIKTVEDNTRAFLAGRAANHVLLTGARGCGKSSVVRGIFAKFYRRGLRLIETDVQGLAESAELRDLIAPRPEKFIVFCDDLSFPPEQGELFNRLKSAMDGALSATPDNLLIYATSNRRNLVAEKYGDNALTFDEDGDIQPLETLDEKISLADRFGLWVPFIPPTPDEYETLVRHWLTLMNIKPTDALLQESRRFADFRSSRNGRIAKQFAVWQQTQQKHTTADN